MHLIAKHLDRSLIENIIETGIDSICMFTGRHINEGVHRKNIISDRFNDHEYLRYPSDYLSVDAALCIAPVIKGEKGYNSLRNYSFLATENEFRILQRGEIMDVLLCPPQPPFVIAVTFSNKKHTAFKTIPALDRGRFIVTTDKGQVMINHDLISELVPVIQKWYTVVAGKEDSSMLPTYFTKDEILFGSSNFKRILEYGEEQYFSENAIIDRYRCSLLLTLIVHVLNKKL